MSTKTANLKIFILVSFFLHLLFAAVLIFKPSTRDARLTNEDTMPVFIKVVSLGPGAKEAKEKSVENPPSKTPAAPPISPTHPARSPSGFPAPIARSAKPETPEEYAAGQEKKPQNNTEKGNMPDDAAKKTTLFPSGQRLTELARIYEKDDGKGEEGKVLSLDTSELKYRNYLLNMKRRIELFWDYPLASVNGGEQGSLRLDFIITKNGSVKGLSVVKSSNYPSLDDAAITAIKLAMPFNPFPDDFTVDNISIRARFEYRLITQSR